MSERERATEILRAPGLLVEPGPEMTTNENNQNLRTLHNRLNQELPRLFGDVRALHDGEEYHFHLTMATGGATMKVHSRANQAFRQAAHSVTRSHSSIGAYYRAMRARLGPKQAIVATAHKIARIVYHLLKTGEPYREESDAEYERKRQEREIKHLTRRAQKLGYTLSAVPATAPASPPEPGSEGSF